MLDDALDEKLNPARGGKSRDPGIVPQPLPDSPPASAVERCVLLQHPTPEQPRLPGAKPCVACIHNARSRARQTDSDFRPRRREPGGRPSQPGASRQSGGGQALQYPGGCRSLRTGRKCCFRPTPKMSSKSWIAGRHGCISRFPAFPAAGSSANMWTCRARRRSASPTLGAGDQHDSDRPANQGGGRTPFPASGSRWTGSR